MTDKPGALVKQFEGMPLARKKKPQDEEKEFSEYDKVSLGHSKEGEANEGGEKSEAGDEENK